MNVLLDTHAFVWFNVNSERFSRHARELIEDSRVNRVFISPASYWEIAIKMSVGKFATATPYAEFWSRGIAAAGFEILPIELRHTSRLIDLPFHHKDPFDRLLVTQALPDGLPIVSDDAASDAYGVERVW